MQSYYLKYGLLFVLMIVLLDIITFISYDSKKDSDISHLLILDQALERPIKNKDILKVNNIIDVYEEKIIIEKEGQVYTSNFGKTDEQRIRIANEQLENSRSFWKPLILPNEKVSTTIYYKIREINYFNKIILNTLYSFALSLCALPIIFFSVRDLVDFSKNVEVLNYYLESSIEQVEALKDRQVVHEYDKSGENEKLHKKLVEAKNKRNILQQEVERKNNEISSLKDNISNLKSDIQNMKNDIQNVKIDRNRVEESKNIILREKQELAKKVTTLEETIETKDKSLEKVESIINNIETEKEALKESVKTKDSEIIELKKSRIDPKEHQAFKEKIALLETTLSEKDKSFIEINNNLSQRNIQIDNLEENLSEINTEKLRLDNEIVNMRTKIESEKSVIELLIEEKNSNQKQISSLSDKVIELTNILKQNKIETNQNLDEIKEIKANVESSELENTLKEKDELIRNLLEDRNRNEAKLKEISFDMLEKQSVLKRFELQVSELSREVLQKNNIIESLNTRLDVKEKHVNSLNKEIVDIKDKLSKI